MTQADPEVSVKWTCDYRREASEIAASLGGSSPIVTGLEQCLGTHALADSTQEPASLDIPSSFLFCHACGCLLQPGTNGTTLRLRSVRRGHTRRRRASRKLARDSRAKKQHSSGGGRKFQQDDENQYVYMQEERDLMQVTDGTCRNAVVVTCGSCGWKLKYKGLPPVKQQQTIRKEEPKKPVVKPPPPKGLGDGDVISLPTKGTGRKDKKRQRVQAISNHAKKQKSSGLLNFLSSLND